MLPHLKPYCRRNDEIQYKIPPVRGLAPIQGMFLGSSNHLDQITRPRRVAATRRIGAPTPAAQDLVQHTQRECPWQLFESPETGQTIIERTYNPEDEPLYQDSNTGS